MESIVLGISGGRDFYNYKLLCKEIDELRKKYKIKKIISGGAVGADKLGEKYARENNIEMIIIKPDWKKNGRKAGILRNKDIVDGADLVIAFWDGVSKGTSNTIERSRKDKKLIKIVYYNQYNIKKGTIAKQRLKEENEDNDNLKKYKIK